MEDKVSCNGNSSGRRLPSWMLVGHKPPQTQDLNNNNNESKEEEIDNGNLTKARNRRTKASEKISKRELGGDEEEAEESSSSKLLVRCEERKRRRKHNDYDVVDGNNDEIPRLKRKRGGRKRSVRNANRTRIDSDNDEDEGSYKETDDDLTIKDLMSIAEEYVSEDKEATQRPLSLEGDLTVEDLTSIAEEYVEEDTRAKGNTSKDEHIAEREVQSVAVSSAGKYDEILSQKAVDSQYLLNENMTNEETIVKPTMTGDPTKDMLDLFLGPLLRKPENEEKFNVIARDLSFACEAQKQKHGVEPGEEAAPLTKKKSSLKDKVAMFLD